MKHTEPAPSTPLGALRQMPGDMGILDQEGDRSSDSRGASGAYADGERSPTREAHAALTGDLHALLGNSVVSAALDGMDAGPEALIKSALTLGAAGMQVADSASGLFSNGFMHQQLAASGPGAGFVAQRKVRRHAAGTDFGDDAGKRVDVALKRGGRALPGELRAQLERAFGGADFSGVRIHTDGAASAAAEGIDAHAFAVGENIYFNRGGFRPDSHEGRRLLAHELTHVVQHQEGRLRPGTSTGGEAGGMAVSSPFDAHEREAESMATQVVGQIASVESVVDAEAPDAGQAVEAGSGAAASMDSSADGASRSAIGSMASAIGSATSVDPGQILGGIPSGLADLSPFQRFQDALALHEQATQRIAGVQTAISKCENALARINVVDAIQGLESQSGIDGIQKAASAMQQASAGNNALQALSGLQGQLGVPFSAGTAGGGGLDPSSLLQSAQDQGQQLVTGALAGLGVDPSALTSSGGALDLSKLTELRSLVGSSSGDLNKAAQQLTGQLESWKGMLGQWKSSLGDLEGQLSSMAEQLGGMPGFSDSDDAHIGKSHYYRKANGLTDRDAQASVPGTSGKALPSQTSAALRAQLGTAVDKVRVHDGPKAAAFARSLNARAVTVGQDIFFDRGELRPGTRSGDQLIGHEVHHAVLGGGAPGVSQPGDAHERAADAFGDTFVADGGTQALTRVGLSAPIDGLSSQINDRLDAQPRSTPSVAEMFPDFADMFADSGFGAETAGVDVAPAVDLAAPSIAPTDLGQAADAGLAVRASDAVGPISTPMGSAETMSRDLSLLPGNAQSAATGASDTTSGTTETEAETHAELMIAGKKYRVKVPPGEGQTATANCDLDARPCEGLHLTGATVNIDSDGVISGGTVRGTLTIEGLIDETQVAMGILPGGQIAPAIENLPVKVGPASGTINASVTEAGLQGSGSLSAAELGLPEWVGLRSGDIDIAFSNGEVSGGGSLTGTTTASGTASLNARLENDTLTSDITYTVTPGLSPAPGVVINNAVLTGTLVHPLKAGEGEGEGEQSASGPGGAGPSTDSPASAPPAVESGGGGPSPQGQAAPLASTSPSGGGGAVAAPSDAQGAMAQGLDSAMGGESAQGSGQESAQGGEQAASGGSGEGQAQGRDPNAFMLRGTGSVTVKDWVQGDIDLAMDPAGGTYDASGKLSATKEMQFGDLLAVKSEVSLTIQSNVPTEASAVVEFTGDKFEGEITGEYDIQGHTLDGSAKVRLTHHWPIEGEWGSIRMLRGGSLDASVDANKLIDINGRVRFDGEIQAGETPLAFEGLIEGTFDAEEERVDGQATAATTGDYILPSLGGEGGGEQQFTLLSGTAVRATIAESTLSQVQMDAKLRYDRDGEEFLLGQLDAAAYDLEAGELSGSGQFTLKKDIERSTSNDKWTLRIKKGANVEATVDKNDLKEIGGDIAIQVDDVDGPLANGILSGAKIKVATWETSGTLKLTTARKFFHPGENQLMDNGFGLSVMPGSGINAKITNDELTDVGADLRCMVLDAEGALARLRLQASWDLENEELDGKGTLALARQMVVAEDLAGQGWTAKVLRGTKAEGHIEKNEFTKVTGEMKAAVDDDQGKFLEVNGTGEWTTADDLFDVVGTITVAREKELAGGDTGWELALLPEASTATATIEDDVFKGINGNISTMVRKTGEDFAKLGLGGSWNETEGFTGEGEAELLVDHDVASLGDYHLWVTKGTGARLEVKQDSIDKIGGKVPMRLDDGGAEFIKGNVEGEYKLQEKKLSGSGSAQVLVEKHLGTLGDDQLWLIPSSNATVTVVENELTQVGGEMNLSVRNGEGEYAKVALAGTFDASGGTGFTGTGGVTVVRDNKLFEVDSYSFWLKEGSGATAHIKEDTLEKIDGSVPFMVKDGSPNALIQGSVTGVYDPATGQITGTGSVYLGRTLEYDLGAGIQLKLLEGSGGDADVKDSKLERLGGSLTAEIWKDGEGIVRVTADGEYNVVTNDLTRLQGTATLLKPLSMLGGAVEVSNVTGTATIENNELVQAGGSGQVIIHPLNDMTGTFEVEWSKQGGSEEYEGRGWLDFTLIDRDPETGRGMSGRVFAEVKSDDTFQAIGEIDYTINDIIGGKLQVSVDQKWDPLLYGTIEVDTDLVEARDLFAMEDDIVPEQTVRLPYGLALFYGMRGGMKMGLDALHLNSSITVGNWRPLSDGNVPQFEAALDLTWGMNFKAMVAPYLALGGDIGFANAQMGVRGELTLDAPVEVAAGGKLKGDTQGFFGELSVGVSLAPTLDLDIIPYIKGGIPNLLEFEEDLDRFNQPLGTLFKFEWGGKYHFGDTSYKEQAPLQALDIPAPSSSTANKTEGKPDLGIGNGGGSTSNRKGAPQIEGGSEIAGQQETGDGDMAQVMETLNDIIAVIEGLGAAGELFGMLASALTALGTFGPAGLIVHIVWGIFTGDLSWDRIKNAVVKVVEAIQAAGRLLRAHFPGWWNSICDVFNGEKPGLLDALFGADDRMREAVGRGDHNYAPYEMHKEMVNTMKGGWLSTDDANCIARIFAVAARRGWLPRLVADCGGADEFIDGWSSGFDDAAIKAVFRRNGIRW